MRTHKTFVAVVVLVGALLVQAVAWAATAVVVPTGVRSVGSNAVMNYAVVILNDPNPPQDFSADYIINSAQTVTQNIANWKNKIVADVAGKGVTITTANIILWGDPS